MIYVTVIACIAVITLAAIVVVQARSIDAERSEWRQERRFLIDRAIAKHMGEVAMLENEDTRKLRTMNQDLAEHAPRPLIEGLS